jgi:hypothetical protein
MDILTEDNIISKKETETEFTDSDTDSDLKKESDTDSEYDEDENGDTVNKRDKEENSDDEQSSSIMGENNASKILVLGTIFLYCAIMFANFLLILRDNGVVINIGDFFSNKTDL